LLAAIRRPNVPEESGYHPATKDTIAGVLTCVVIWFFLWLIL